MKTSFLTIFLIVGASVFSQTTAPAWLDDIQKVYPSNAYIAFVGQGKSAQDARNDGLQQLAGFYGTSVQSLLEGKTKVSISGDQSNVERKIEENVKVRISSDVFAVRYSESVSAKGIFYIVVYQKISELTQFAKESIDKYGKKMIYLLESAKKSTSSLIALGKIIGARSLANTMESLQSSLRLTGSSESSTLLKAYPIDEVFDLYDEYSLKARIKVVAINDEAQAFAKQIASMLSTEGYLLDEAGKIILGVELKQVKTADSDREGVQVQFQMSISIKDENGIELVSKFKKGTQTWGTFEGTKNLIKTKYLDPFIKNEFLASLGDFLATNVK